MLKNMLLAVTVAAAVSAVAVSAAQLKSVPRANGTCNGPCSNTKPCPTDVNGCTCLTDGTNGRGLCEVIGPAATAKR